MSGELKPCPFCGKDLAINRRKHNPYARCATENCKGGRLPLLNLDQPEDVAAWNTRATLSPAHIEDGEEVEVVERYRAVLGGLKGLAWERLQEFSLHPSVHAEVVELMTVAQHQRIAARGEARSNERQAAAEELARLLKESADEVRELRAELEAIRGQQVVGRVHHNEEHAEPVRAVLNSAGRQLPDDARLYALPPQQPDAWPTLDKPAKVGPVLFNPGLSARLVVEAAQRQHEYSQQPEVEAARLERFGAFMREVHGENGDGGASDGP